MYPAASSTVYQGQSHDNEFVTILDSLGRRWNPLLHPRDRLGRFIRTFSTVSLKAPGTLSSDPDNVTGRVAGVDKDGSVLIKITAIKEGTKTDLQVGQYVRAEHGDIEVKTVKARIGNTAKKVLVGRISAGAADRVRKNVSTLNREFNMTEAGRKLEEAISLAEADYDIKDPRNAQAAQRAKDRAIDLFREVGDLVAEERAKGFKEGDDYDALKAGMSKGERARLQKLDDIHANTLTLRHEIGDRTLDLRDDRGMVPAKGAERRIGVIENELFKDQEEGAVVWDVRGGKMVKGVLEDVQQKAAIDTPKTDDVAESDALPELRPATFQKLRAGLDRVAGFRQQKQVSVGDRWHVDRDGNQISVGSIVDVSSDAKGRPEFTGPVVRVYWDNQAKKKKIAVRDFVSGPDDPKSSDPAYAKGYKDFKLVSESMSVADVNDDNNLFQQLASQGVSPGSLIDALSAEYAAQRRLAGKGAKRISPTSGNFFDAIPVQERVKPDANGEAVKIGDHVENVATGAQGVVVYVEPNSNNIRVEYPNGQRFNRETSKNFVRLHGATSEVFLQDYINNGNNYIPTRDEASALADEMGATSVAESIRNGEDREAIQEAMRSDAAFQEALKETGELFKRRDMALSSGNEVSDEDYAALAKWNKLMSASSAQFREATDTPPTIVDPPTGTESAQDPSNSGRKVNPDGTSEVEGGEPTDIGTEAEADDAPEIEEVTPEEAPGEQQAAGLAAKIRGDLAKLITEAKRAPGSNVTQKLQLDQYLERLDEAIENQDANDFVRHLRNMNSSLSTSINRNLARTPLMDFLRGKFTNNVTMADFVQAKVDAGENIFGQNAQARPESRPESSVDETPDGVDPNADKADTDLAESLLDDNGNVVFANGDTRIDDGFYVIEPSTVRDFDAMPTVEDVRGFFEEFSPDSGNSVSIWQGDDGIFHMGIATVSDNEDEIKAAAELNGAGQYVDIASGQVYNLAESADTDVPVESIEDSRSEARGVRKAGSGKATARTTSKQKSVLDKVAELPDAPTDVIDKVKSGEEIDGADASRLADFINKSDVGGFDKPSDKGVAQQLADRIARASGETGARPYSSQNTALRRTSDVGISLDALSQDDEVRGLTEEARNAVKDGDYATAADKFREAADRYEGLGLPNQSPAERAREHAARLDAASSTAEPDAAAPEAPEAPEPTASVDPQAFFDLMKDPAQVEQLSRSILDWRESATKAAEKLTSTVARDDRVAREIEQVRLTEVEQPIGEAAYILQSLANRPGFTLDDVSMMLDSFGPDTLKVLGLATGDQSTPFDFADGKEFMEARLARVTQDVVSEVDEVLDPDATFDMRLMRYQVMSRSNVGAVEYLQGNVTSSDFVNSVSSVIAGASLMEAARDPQVRLKMRRDQLDEITRVARDIGGQVMAFQSYLDRLSRDRSFDSSTMRQAVREQLDRAGAGDLMDLENGDIMSEKVRNALRAVLTPSDNSPDKRARDASKFIKTLGSELDEMTPSSHYSQSLFVDTILPQLKFNNGGKLPNDIVSELRKPAWSQYGAFTEILQELDVNDLAASDPAGVAEATNGQWDVVTFDGADVLDNALIADDRQTKVVIKDEMFQMEVDSLSPNVSRMLNSLWGKMGGGFHRTTSNIAQASTPMAQKWRTEGWDRSGGDDDRSPTQVEGVYSFLDNTVTIADSRIGMGGTSVVHHELGHALDGMLGRLGGIGGFFTKKDERFLEFVRELKDAADFSTPSDPYSSLLFWYFQMDSDGAKRHNGKNGNAEIFAEGYAGYLKANLDQTMKKDTPFYYKAIARALSLNRQDQVRASGKLSDDDLSDRLINMGKAISSYFDYLENVQLPELLGRNPQVVRKLRAFDFGGTALAPNGLIEGEIVESFDGPPVDGEAPEADAPGVPAAPAGVGG